MKLLKHERDLVGDYQKRVLIHIPIGFLIGVAFPLSYPILLLFIRYEENEDMWVKDRAWKDYAGAIAGAIVGLLTLIGIIFWSLKGG